MIKKQPSIDLTLVSGRRPSLIEKTLNSFTQKLLAHFDVANIIINVDPFGGDLSDHTKTIKIIRDFFPSAAISEPQRASFGTAVREIWLRSSSEFIFHLEDDWLLEEELRPDDVFPLFTGATAALQLVSVQHDWDGNTYKTRIKTNRFLGLPFRKRVYNIFGTSPGFWQGEVARRTAALMDPNLDPEKQMRPPLNKNLFSYLNNYRCRMLPGKQSEFLITDIGRQWRTEKGIEKTILDGKSVWVSEQRANSDKS